MGGNDCSPHRCAQTETRYKAEPLAFGVQSLLDESEPASGIKEVPSGRVCRSKEISHPYADVVEWYTRRTQNAVVVRPCGFESHHRHHFVTLRDFQILVIAQNNFNEKRKIK